MDGMAPDDLGLRIRRARERKRWSQQRLAAALGVGVRAVGRWERGEAVPRSAIGAIEEVLGVDLSGEQDLQVQEIRAMGWLTLQEQDDWIALYHRRKPPPPPGERAG